MRGDRKRGREGEEQILDSATEVDTAGSAVTQESLEERRAPSHLLSLSSQSWPCGVLILCISGLAPEPSECPLEKPRLLCIRLV